MGKHMQTEMALSIQENNKIRYTLIHFGSIPASAVLFPTRHVDSITCYLTDCHSRKVECWDIAQSAVLLVKTNRGMLVF
jgi:hypothetical protein